MSIRFRSPLLAGAITVLVSVAGVVAAVPGRAGQPPAPAGHVVPSSLSAGRAGPAAARRPPATFRWPLDGPVRLVRRFDPPPHPWSAGHRGVDLAAAPGATVRAAGPGTVAFAGLVAGRPVLSVSHPGGLRTTYEPVDAAVRAGDPVSAGAVLGRLRSGHPCAEAACLHWGLRRDAEYLDPLILLGLGRVRLLPIEPP